MSDNAASSQRSRLIARLISGSVTKLEAIKELDILTPTSRVWELRHRFGQTIEIYMVIRTTEAGKPHRIGLYVLTTEKPTT